MKTAFIGHRQVFAKNISERLANAIQTEIANGCREFTMGVHGNFDKLALNTCRSLRKNYIELKIEVVLTSLNAIKKESVFDNVPYADVKTVMYDIEGTHYKQRITLSNRQMLDTCNTLICYVNASAYRSGAKTALRYAEKKGLKIINLFRKEDEPFYGMTEDEAKEHWNRLYERAMRNEK